jgi:hypothetical protein
VTHHDLDAKEHRFTVVRIIPYPYLCVKLFILLSILCLLLLGRETKDCQPQESPSLFSVSQSIVACESMCVL